MIEAESAFRTITIQVTQEDIDNGIRRTVMLSPVARAISRYIVEEGYVVVDYHFITFIHGSKVLTIDIPRLAAAFMLLFDSEVEVVPFRFRLKIPRWILKEGNK